MTLFMKFVFCSCLLGSKILGWDLQCSCQWVTVGCVQLLTLSLWYRSMLLYLVSEMLLNVIKPIKYVRVKCDMGKEKNLTNADSDVYFQIVAEKQKFKKNPHNYAIKKTFLLKQKVIVPYWFLWNTELLIYRKQCYIYMILHAFLKNCKKCLDVCW